MTSFDYDLIAPVGARIVPLYGAKAAGRVALVDEADYDLVMQYRWNVQETARPDAGRPAGPYALARIRRDGRPTTILMHTLITGWPQTDHEDHDGLNNRRGNLRPATNWQNRANSRKRGARCLSAFKGVTYVRHPGGWRAQITVNRQNIHLGYFPREESAARAYDIAALTQWGEFACTNFPASDYAEAGAA